MKTKKAQGLPITTIILIVLAIVVLAALLLFFFTGFGKPSGTLSTQQALSSCQSKCSIVASSNPKTNTSAGSIATSQGFCDSIVVDGVSMLCDDLIICRVDSAQCTLNCSSTPKCQNWV